MSFPFSQPVSCHVLSYPVNESQRLKKKQKKKQKTYDLQFFFTCCWVDQWNKLICTLLSSVPTLQVQDSPLLAVCRYWLVSKAQTSPQKLNTTVFSSGSTDNCWSFVPLSQCLHHLSKAASPHASCMHSVLGVAKEWPLMANWAWSEATSGPTLN